MCNKLSFPSNEGLPCLNMACVYTRPHYIKAISCWSWCISSLTNTTQAWFSFGRQHHSNKIWNIWTHETYPTHFWFRERSEKHTLVTLKLLTSEQAHAAKLTSLPFFLVILYPCFLIYFSEAPLTVPRCVSVSLTEKMWWECVKSEKEGERKREKEGDTKGTGS